MAEDTPEQRARHALVAMIDAGEAPTARAVRQRSGVAMKVATDVVAAWKRDRDAETQAPPIPADVQTRLTAIWAEAYAAADAIHRPARDKADQLAAAITAERDELLGDVADLEGQVSERAAERDAARAERDEARQENGVLQARLEEVRARNTDLELRISTQDQDIGQLRAQLDELRRQLDDTTTDAPVAKRRGARTTKPATDGGEDT